MGRRQLQRTLVWLAVLAIVPGGQREEFDVAHEFELKPIVELPSIGPVDLFVIKGILLPSPTLGLVHGTHGSPADGNSQRRIIWAMSSAAAR